MGPATKELPACPVETTLTQISDNWKVLILRDLLPGTKRFGELKKSIGHVSQKVLTAQLREMESNGLLTRTVYAEVPPRVEYTLTDLGYSLKPILDAMWNWGEEYKAKQSQTSGPGRFIFSGPLISLLWPFSSLRIVVLVEGEYKDRVTVASTASEYPLADFRFRGTPAPKHKNCLLGQSQTLIRNGGEAEWQIGNETSR